MLEILNRYQHGFSIVPVLYSFKNNKVYDLLNDEHRVTLETLSNLLHANRGSLKVALKSLYQLDLAGIDEDGRYFLKVSRKTLELIPDGLMEFYKPSFLDFISGEGGINNEKLSEKFRETVLGCLKQAIGGWGVGNALLEELFDGAILVPILISLRQKRKTDNDSIPFFSNDGVSVLIEELFHVRGILNERKLTELGSYLFNKAFNMAVLYSYWPMYQNINEILFGDYQSVFKRNSLGYENHVDRNMNVIGFSALIN